ncbi:MAG: TIGR01777 family oxidoreductase [Candidatus Kapabacteria bacterium]|nr:TIGR01777 family oxidoreductase [Candidatus Kapabacteria bacterium]MDW8012210.1 TIGR01777 family oxidoreductase [Bacteroidota bacterium]
MQTGATPGLRLLLVGGTGGLGRRIVPTLTQQGYQVRLLVRSLSRAKELFPGGVEYYVWNPQQELPASALEGVWGVLNLAGAPIVRRWTRAYRQIIQQSRVGTTRQLVQALHEAPHAVQVFLSVSAVGYYGNRGDELCRETAPPGTDFLAQVCREWEEAALRAADRVRVIIPRLGIVLDRQAGFLPRLLPTFRAFLGGTIGSGQQWVSWIHWSDVVSFVLWALQTPTVQGVYNAVAPSPVRFQEFCQTLGRLLRRPCWLRVPTWALRLQYGELADALNFSQRVVPERALAEGFTFRFPTLEAALKAELDGNSEL